MLEAGKTDPMPAPAQLAGSSPAARTEGLLQRGDGRLSRNFRLRSRGTSVSGAVEPPEDLGRRVSIGNAHSRESDFRLSALKPHNHDGQAS